MSKDQASETSQQPKFSPYPLFLYAIVSSIVSWLLLPQFVARMFYSKYIGMFDMFSGYFCAQVTLFGIIAGLVGRHWLHGMALSLGLQTLICTLAFALDTANKDDDQIYAITGRYHSSLILLQYSVLTVVLPAIPALLMRKLQSWRLVLNPTPRKSSSIQGLLVATTFVAMITASAIQSYQSISETSIIFGVIGLGAVAFFLPVVRASLSSPLSGWTQFGSNFRSQPKAEVVAYSLLLGITGMAVLTLFGPRVGLFFGLHYALFIVCLWFGIWCLGATGLRFRSQSVDDQSQSRSKEEETRATQSLEIAQSPFTDDNCETRQNEREPAEVVGRLSLVTIAVLITGFTLFKIWAAQR